MKALDARKEMFASLNSSLEQSDEQKNLSNQEDNDHNNINVGNSRHDENKSTTNSTTVVFKDHSSMSSGSLFNNATEMSGFRNIIIRTNLTADQQFEKIDALSKIVIGIAKATGKKLVRQTNKRIAKDRQFNKDMNHAVETGDLASDMNHTVVGDRAVSRSSDASMDTSVEKKNESSAWDYVIKQGPVLYEKINQSIKEFRY